MSFHVEFRLPYTTNPKYGSKVKIAMIDAAIDALGVDKATAEECMMTGVRFICTPEQFTKFLILRNEYGGSNSYAALEARMIDPTPKPVTTLNVTGNQK